MMMSFASRRALLVFTLAALPFLAGSSCAVFWSSSDDSSDEDERKRDDEGFVIVATGHFGDPPVAGLRYAAGDLSGTTGENGEFDFEPGKPVQFFLGDISLGPPVAAQPLMTAKDLGAEATGETNIRRLLWSLDAEPGDSAITIPAAVQATAVTTNADVAWAIAFLDFADDEAFANSASQLVAVLAADYPFTAVLAEAGDVAGQPGRAVAP